MLGDRLFYPIAMLVTGLTIFLAIRPALGALPTGPVSVGDLQYDRIVVDGIQLNRIEAGGDANITLVGSGENTRIQVETVAGTLSDDPRLGPHFRLAADLERQFSGFTMTITVRAKPGEAPGATQMKVNYSTGRDGESDWQIFDLKPEFDDHSFRYDVPLKSGANGLDYLAIRPVTPEKTRNLLIERVTFERGKRWAEVSG